jgi:hypothetical protein
MINNIKQYLAKLPPLKNVLKLQNRLLDELHKNRLLLGKIMLLENKVALLNVSELEETEFSIFSQWNEDGANSILVRSIDIKSRRFIEFGVETYMESNTRFLMANNNWAGLVIDGSSEHIRTIKGSDWYWKSNLTAVCAFVNTKNIETIIADNGFDGEVGLLSIDIDGNDYWIWESMNNVEPAIVVIEYNALFGNDRAITVPYKEDFVRENENSSYLYWGASLPALKHLAGQKGYIFVGCESHGVNAFFVRKDKINKKLENLAATARYYAPQFRQSRNKLGQLDYLTFEQQTESLKGVPVVNVITGKHETF